MATNKTQPVAQEELWVSTNLRDTCERCGLYKTCSRFAPKQLPAVGCPDKDLQVLFVVPFLDEQDIQHNRILASDARFRVLDRAMRAAGFQEGWQRTMAQFVSPLRCGGRADKTQKDLCRDLLWVADILQKRPRLIVTLGDEKFSKNSSQKISAFVEAFGAKTKDVPGRGRVRTLREAVGEHYLLQAQVNVEQDQSEQADKSVRSVRAAVEVPDDIHVMNVNSLQDCLIDPGLLEFLHHDLAKIPRILDGTYQRRTSFEGRQYRTVETLEEAIEVFKYLASLERFAYDLETGPSPYSLDPYSRHSKILCLAVADPWRRAWVIPWEHKDSPLRDKVCELAQWFDWVGKHNVKIDTWNGKFDNRWMLVKHGIHIVSHRDGMLDRGLLDENKDKTLKTWAEMHTDLGYYDEELQEYFVDEKGRPIAKKNKCYEKHVPFEVLCRYAAADADATMQLTLRQEKALSEAGLLEYSRIFTMPDAEATAKTEHYGVAVDWEHREQVGAGLLPKIEEVRERIRADENVEKWRKARAADFVRQGRLFWHAGYIYSTYDAWMRGDTPLYSEQHQAGYDEGQVKVLLDKKYLRKHKGRLAVPTTKRYTVNDLELKLNSTKDLREFIYGRQFLNLPVKERTKKSDAPSTDAGVLKNNAHLYPILGLIEEHRKLLKWRSTYYDPVCNGTYTTINAKGDEIERVGWVRDDGLVHAEFLMTGDDKGQDDNDGKGGTVTGRKSCKTPNLQNQKSRGEGAKEIKKYFISKHRAEGGLILQADYSQLELRLFAVIAGSQWMLDKYRQGADLHAELAMELFNRTYEQVMADGGYWRSAAKEFWFGPIYGESARGIVAQLAKMHGIEWNVAQGEAALKRMYDRIPEYEAYKARFIRSLEETCSVTTVFGRRRFLPTYLSSEGWLRARAVRQAGNFLIQSPGAEMTNYAWGMLVRWMEEVRLRSRIVISVHDSLVSDVVREEAKLVVAGKKLVMESLPFSFVKNAPIRFTTDMEIGPSWGEVKSLSEVPEFEGFVPEYYQDSRLDPLRERCANIIF